MSASKSDDAKGSVNQDAMPQTNAGQGGADSKTGEVTPGRVEYLVAVRPNAGLHPTATDMMFAALSAMPDVEILDRIQPRDVTAPAISGASSTSDVIVIRTTLQRGLELQMTADPTVVVERNHVLAHLADLDPQFSGVSAGLPFIAPASLQLQFKVVGDKRQPLQKALIVLYGGGFPVQAETDAHGLATLTLFGGTVDTVQAVHVKPVADFWGKWIPAPVLSDSGVNTISVEPLSAFQAAGLGSKPFLGWGQRLMGVDVQATGTLTGQGSRVAIIDSGCDNKHSALTHIQIGRDYTNLDADGKPDQSTWTVDTISHGTHCAGTIAGNGQSGIRGFAPAGEVHILKLFPGGAFDNLISALKYAIDNQIDVVNCSLGSSQSSEIVQQWMEQARQAGVAVVVAAGNSAGPVQFPASLASVLSVSAIGQQGQYPADTCHAQTMPAGPGLIGVNGVFAAKFSCFGPQIKVCAPGVAIISSVPGGGYAAWDGTSMAAAHITGLAALVAAHHPAVKDAPRNAARVDRLFQTVLAAAMPVGLNPVYGGAGLPSVSAAFQASLAPQSFAQAEEIIRNALLVAMNRYSSGFVPPAATMQQGMPGGFEDQLRRH
ncbi:subtilisin [Paraburkholderia sp. UCT70]|uniref:S8 family serine peptidase n=1 Tax=Paraburkholderia sp. UCT70 TaxID=2991068 RepID=UPI003D1B4DBB